jgi:hypothetical protein
VRRMQFMERCLEEPCSGDKGNAEAEEAAGGEGQWGGALLVIASNRANGCVGASLSGRSGSLAGGCGGS